MIAIYAVKANKGYYITKDPQSTYGPDDRHSLSEYLFDGVKRENTFHPSWGFIKQPPAKVTCRTFSQISIIALC
jgi:hypothetical protein